MSGIKQRALGGLLAGLLLQGLSALALAQSAGDALRVEYHQWKEGRDGVRQEMSYAERRYRAAGHVWIERELPDHAEQEHAGHGHGGLGHRHADVVGAPLWLHQDDRGVLRVRLVDRHEQRLIDIDPPYYASVGFAGTWAENWSLADPAALAALTPQRVSADGIETHVLQRGTRTITVMWQPVGEYVVSIDEADQSGRSGRTIRATEIPWPDTVPWSQVTDFLPRDYSDLLD